MKYLILCSLLLTATAFAGKEGGNGGDVLVCKDENKKITSIELLDFYEARVKGRIKGIYLGDDSLSFTEKVHYAIDRLEKLDQRRAKKYRDRFEVFFNEDQFGWADRLVNIDDTGSLGIPQHCEIEQIATQEEPSLPGDKRILIVEKYWNLLDSNNKAGLVLHELIYSEAMDLRQAYLNRPEGAIHLHSNSKKVRYFNSIIGSHDFNDMNYSEYYDVVRESDLIYVSFDGIYFPLVYFDKLSEGSKRQNAAVRFYAKTNNPSEWGRADGISHLFAIPEHAFVEEYATSKYITSRSKNQIEIYRPNKLDFDNNGKLNSRRISFKGYPTIRVSDYFSMFLVGEHSYLSFESGELSDIQKEVNGDAKINFDGLKITITLRPYKNAPNVPVIFKDMNGMPDFRSLNYYNSTLGNRYDHSIYINDREAKLSFYQGLNYDDLFPVRMFDNSYYLSGFKNLHFDSVSGEPKACIYRSLTKIFSSESDSEPVLCASFEELWKLKAEQLRPYGGRHNVKSKFKSRDEIREMARNRCEKELHKYNSELYLKCRSYCHSDQECTGFVLGKGVSGWLPFDLFMH